MTDWRYHTPSRLQSRQKDFRTINKISVKRGLSTSKVSETYHVVLTIFKGL